MAAAEVVDPSRLPGIQHLLEAAAPGPAGEADMTSSGEESPDVDNVELEVSAGDAEDGEMEEEDEFEEAEEAPPPRASGPNGGMSVTEMATKRKAGADDATAGSPPKKKAKASNGAARPTAPVATTGILGPNAISGGVSYDGIFPKLNLHDVYIDGQKVNAAVHKKRGEHPTRPGAFYWQAQKGRQGLFNGWYTVEEAMTMILELFEKQAAKKAHREGGNAWVVPKARKEVRPKKEKRVIEPSPMKRGRPIRPRVEWEEEEMPKRQRIPAQPKAARAVAGENQMRRSYPPHRRDDDDRPGAMAMHSRRPMWGGDEMPDINDMPYMHPAYGVMPPRMDPYAYATPLPVPPMVPPAPSAPLTKVDKIRAELDRRVARDITPYAGMRYGVAAKTGYQVVRDRASGATRRQVTREMEDSHRIVSSTRTFANSPTGLESYTIFALADGSRSTAAATFHVEKAVELVQQLVARKIEESHYDLHGGIPLGAANDFFTVTAQNAFRQEMLHVIEEVRNLYANEPDAANGGSATLLLNLVWGDWVITAHAGDTRSVLLSQEGRGGWRVLNATVDAQIGRLRPDEMEAAMTAAAAAAAAAPAPAPPAATTTTAAAPSPMPPAPSSMLTAADLPTGLPGDMSTPTSIPMPALPTPTPMAVTPAPPPIAAAAAAPQMSGVLPTPVVPALVARPPVSVAFTRLGDYTNVLVMATAGLFNYMTSRDADEQNNWLCQFVGDNAELQPKDGVVAAMLCERWWYTGPTLEDCSVIVAHVTRMGEPTMTDTPLYYPGYYPGGGLYPMGPHQMG